MDTSVILEWPMIQEENLTDFTDRPDYKQFDQQMQSSDWQLKLLKRDELPKLSWFANGFYGRPGLNNLNYDTHFSGITGLNLKWNIGNIYSHSHQKKELIINRDIIKTRQSIFEIEMDKQINQLNNDILKNKQVIEKDDEIVQIRSEVKKVASVQLENGAITLTDYLFKLDAESQATANRTIHKIALMMDLAKLKTLINKNH
jgi:hypothetical protein